MGLLSLILLLAHALPAYGQGAYPELADDLQFIRQQTEEALAASQAAAQAAAVEDVKQGADQVFARIWGTPSGLVGTTGEAQMHGWKERWQVDGTEFDEKFVARLGSEPPTITDPEQLGIIGMGLHVRKQLQALIDDADTEESVRNHAGHVIASLNNVIGWMKMDDGVTKGELQPRVDLTREWDAPDEFWLSSADTGWMYEVYAQALNILKTDYASDVDMARRHAADMTALLEKAIAGVDANNNGSVEPAMMEGGLTTVYEHAGYGGFYAP